MIFHRPAISSLPAFAARFPVGSGGKLWKLLFTTSGVHPIHLWHGQLKLRYFLYFGETRSCMDHWRTDFPGLLDRCLAAGTVILREKAIGWVLLAKLCTRMLYYKLAGNWDPTESPPFQAHRDVYWCLFDVSAVDPVQNGRGSVTLAFWSVSSSINFRRDHEYIRSIISGYPSLKRVQLARM